MSEATDRRSSSSVCLTSVCLFPKEKEFGNRRRTFVRHTLVTMTTLRWWSWRWCLLGKEYASDQCSLARTDTSFGRCAYSFPTFAQAKETPPLVVLRPIRHSSGRCVSFYSSVSLSGQTNGGLSFSPSHSSGRICLCRARVP